MRACHDAGDWQHALDAYAIAWAAPLLAEVPLDAVRRRLDCLAQLGRRDAYRQVVGDQRDRLSLRDPHYDRLNEFGRHVRPSIAWVRVRGLGTGSGFLAAPNLVVTNRHVVCDEDGAAARERIVVHLGGGAQTVERIRFPPDPDIDLAILELAPSGKSAPTEPVRVGYSGLVEVGERVLAIGFPLPEGESVEENLLLDHGIMNRIRTRTNRREFELGVKVSSGMSGGPIFNDRGEVVAVITFVRYQTTDGPRGVILDRSSHAIAVDALHPLLPPPWA